MSEGHALLVDTAARLFASFAGDDDIATAWPRVEDAGLSGLLLSEDAGGFGGDWCDAFAVFRLCGVHALPLPVGEAITAARLCAMADLPTRTGITTLAPGCAGALDARGRFIGRLEAAPWGADAECVVANLDGRLIRLATADAKCVTRRMNPAGEPRDDLAFEGAPVDCGDAGLTVHEVGAFIRAAQIAGALDGALALSIEHANARQQFGKPIGKFQAVQQSLAMFAEEAAAANSAGQAAARAMDAGDAGFEIGAAKLRSNIAAGVGVAAAHQTHGAIGFTQDHALHHLTRRLIGWRSEFGGDRSWAQRLGAGVCARGAEDFWSYLTGRPDAAGKDQCP